MDQFTDERTVFCRYCGAKIPEDAVVCTACGRQVKALQQEPPQVIINNNNTNQNVNAGGYAGVRPKDKWVSFFLCLLLGWLGAHKFYEGKIGMGILYLLTLGLFGVGIIVDLIVILFKPNPYFV
ncbi:MAG: TM2 domain-containing protein [Clostridiales bacterium]|nr:TM2 domain-containing protein [Clostridiales bacterium]